MLKILQARLQQYVNHKLPDVQAGFRKGRGTRDQIANICWIIKKQENSRKTSTFWLCQSLWLCRSQQTLKNSSRGGNTRPPDLPLENLYADQEATVRTGHGTTDWFQIGKRVRQGCILSPCFLTYMQSTSWEMLDWKKHKLESRLPGEISITSHMQMTPPLLKKAKN